jgi:8-oxo-dGTP diphosphatase
MKKVNLITSNKMKNRIRVAALIFENNKLLLVKHVNPKTGFEWWVPPGGGLKEKETIFECAKREVWEETNLNVILDRPVYLRQFICIGSQNNNIEIFLIEKSHEGKKSIDNIKGLGDDEEYIKEVKFFSKEEIKTIVVFPEIIKDEMWIDYKNNFSEIRFLGVNDDFETRTKNN